MKIKCGEIILIDKDGNEKSLGKIDFEKQKELEEKLSYETYMKSFNLDK